MDFKWSNLSAQGHGFIHLHMLWGLLWGWPFLCMQERGSVACLWLVNKVEINFSKYVSWTSNGPIWVPQVQGHTPLVPWYNSLLGSTLPLKGAVTGNSCCSIKSEWVCVPKWRPIVSKWSLIKTRLCCRMRAMLRVPLRHPAQLRWPLQRQRELRRVLAGDHEADDHVLQDGPERGRAVHHGARLRPVRHGHVRRAVPAPGRRDILEGAEQLLPLRLRQLQRGEEELCQPSYHCSCCSYSETLTILKWKCPISKQFSSSHCYFQKAISCKV